MLGNKEQRTKGIRRQAQELIDQAYDRGFKAGKEEFVTTETKVVNEAYQNGLNDAWECARKICAPSSEGGLSHDEMLSIFGSSSFNKISKYNTTSEAIAKIKAYEEQKKAEEEKIEVWDEVIDLTSPEKAKAIVTNIFDNKISVVWDDGAVGTWYERDFKKTGRHFPQISEILKQLQEGE